MREILFNFENTLMNAGVAESAFISSSLYTLALKKASNDPSYSYKESSLFLPSDTHALEESMLVVDSKVQVYPLSYIFVIGIGGSNLGTKAVYDALYGYYDVVTTRKTPKIIFLDTVETSLLNETINFIKNNNIHPKQTLFFVISKSGTTTETLVNTEILINNINSDTDNYINRIIVITDKNSLLWQSATQKNISTLSIPANVGGRYSVLSPVGLAPLYACGIDIKKLVSGASAMREICLSEDYKNNPAIMSGVSLFSAIKEGKNIHDTFVFYPAFESLAKWYRQLLGESIGKEKDNQENIINAGLTPTVSVGSTDLHSVGQLYLGGPKDKVTTFLSVKNTSSTLSVPDNRIFTGIIPMIDLKSTKAITSAILDGIEGSYKKRGLPFIDIRFEGVHEESLGAFFQFKMMEIMYLANLLNINAFDQPNVESYKIETKRILENN